jgi:dynein heavy chain
MRLLDCYLNKYKEDEVKKVSAEQIETLAAQIKPIFMFSFIWSVGGTTDLVGRKRFDAWMRERCTKHNVTMPAEKQVYDWHYSLEKSEWISWFDTIPVYDVDIRAAYNEILVPTEDSIRMKYLMRTLVSNDKHVLMPGPTGTGKSAYVAQLTTYGMPEEFLTLVMCFSAQTGANQTQDYLQSNFEKRRKNVWGPPLGKKFIVFIDDLNMPQKEEFGAQPPIELIRQFMDFGGWYDREDKEKPWLAIQDIIIISAMGPPGGGRAVVTQRLQRHFNIIAYTEMSFSAISIIYTTIVNAFFATFSNDVQAILPDLVQSQLEVYDQVLNGPMKPTPAKSHYTFNLRDISKIFQGVVMANSKLTQIPVELLRLWYHENTRVIGDRLINSGDRKFLSGVMEEQIETKFKITRDDLFNSERIIFADFMDGIEVDVRIYKQIEDLKNMQTKIEEFLIEYNGSVKTQMNLVMFLDACDHVARIQRIIRQPLGNAFLMGVGGSGRQSLTRLATYLANYKIFQVEVVKGYSMSNWREDVKKALMQAGCENKPTSFLFVDTQIIKEQQLEDINNILNGGDVPNLYKLEDMDPIFKVGKQMCMEKQLTVTKMNMFQQYLGRIKRNIHMVMAMSPLGDVFRARIRRFPSLVTCSTIDWFSEWPEEALLGVGRGQMATSDIDLGKDFDACVEMFKVIHQSVEKKSEEFKEQLNRKNYVTPTSFLEQLAMYRQILKTKRIDVGQSRQRLVTGLEVLAQAAVEIAKLENEIQVMAPELAATKKTLAETMVVLSKEKAEAEVEQNIVAKDSAAAQEQEAAAASMKEEAERELSKATPLLEEALRVLRELQKSDLYSLATMRIPTPTVVVVMEIACHMFALKPGKANLGGTGDPQGYFDLAKRSLLKDPTKFLDMMMKYDKENITDKCVKNVRNIVDKPEFSLEDVRKANQAMEGICKWAMAMMKYYDLLKIVNPMREKVAEMNAQLAIVRKDLAEKLARLKAVEEKLGLLEATYQEKLETEQRLQAKIDSCNLKLERAGKIITGLAGEKQRWTDTVERLGKEYDHLVGNCLIAAGMVAYSGPFTAQYRQALELEWYNKITELGVKIATNISMKEILEDPVQTKTWTANSLPSDNLSIENAIIMFKSRRWPLMIDPQSQANKFIKNLSRDPEEAKSGIDTCKMSEPTLLRNLELAIQFGKWFLIENVGEELDPALEPILLKQIDKSG